jgi:hypothetical protein
MVATVAAGGNKSAATAVDAVPQKVPFRGVDFPVKKGTEGRDDAPADYYERALSSPRSDRDDRGAPLSNRRSKARPDVGSDVASVTRGRRSNRCPAPIRNLSGAPSRKGKAAYIKTDNDPIASRRSKTAAPNNDIINLGMDFELGLGGSVARRRSKHSTTNATITSFQTSGHTGKPPSASYLVNKTEDHISEAFKQSDVSVTSDAKSRKSLRHIFSKNKEASSHKSPGKVSTTQPHSSKATRNNHSSKKEPASMSYSKQSELEYWSGLSVRVATTVMQANGSEKMAQKASSIVLDEARRQSGRERSSKMMRALSAKLSVALLEAGGDQKVGLAVMNAVMAYEKNNNGVKSAESMTFEDSRQDHNARGKVVDEVESVAPSLARTSRSSISRSNRSKAVSSTPSIASKRSKLQTLEKQIAEKQRAIEEAELRNQEREREFNEQIAAMEAAAKERLAALNAAMSFDSAEADQQDMIADESKSANKEYNGNETKSAFQSGVDEFVLSFNERIAAMEAAAKESLAALDATKTGLLEKASAAQADRQNMMADDSKSANKEDNAKETKSAFQSGVDEFVLSFNERIAAMEAAARESLAALDAKKAALLEKKASAVQPDRQDMLADESKSAKEEVKREDIATETASAVQMLTSRFFQSFDSRSVGISQEVFPGIDSLLSFVTSSGKAS